jgi:hypothetical protein
MLQRSKGGITRREPAFPLRIDARSLQVVGTIAPPRAGGGEGAPSSVPERAVALASIDWGRRYLHDAGAAHALQPSLITMHKKRSLKAPFVVTVSAVASASMLACLGGSSDQGLTGAAALSGTDPAPSNTAAGSKPVPPVATNPPPVPVPPTATNPPPPHPPTCPAEQPQPGSPCDGDLTCTFPANGNTPCPGPTATCDAQTKTWLLSVVSCNPPPPPPACPADLPAGGSACAVADQSCSYPNGSGCPGPRATCDAQSKTWMIAITSCKPPPPPVCPPDIPKMGDPCLRAQTCEYPSGTGCPGPKAVCDPVAGVWSVGVTACNPPIPPQP